jgi:hypothetical protein
MMWASEVKPRETDMRIYWVRQPDSFFAFFFVGCDAWKQSHGKRAIFYSDVARAYVAGTFAAVAAAGVKL